jgi:hypothetical protein
VEVPLLVEAGEKERQQRGPSSSRAVTREMMKDLPRLSAVANGSCNEAQCRSYSMNRDCFIFSLKKINMLFSSSIVFVAPFSSIFNLSLSAMASNSGFYGSNTGVCCV